MHDPFLAEFALRHTPASVADPLLHVLAAAEEMAGELSRLRGHTAGPAADAST